MFGDSNEQASQHDPKPEAEPEEDEFDDLLGGGEDWDESVGGDDVDEDLDIDEGVAGGEEQQHSAGNEDENGEDGFDADRAGGDERPAEENWHLREWLDAKDACINGTPYGEDAGRVLKAGAKKTGRLLQELAKAQGAWASEVLRDCCEEIQQSEEWIDFYIPFTSVFHDDAPPCAACLDAPFATEEHAPGCGKKRDRAPTGRKKHQHPMVWNRRYNTRLQELVTKMKGITHVMEDKPWVVVLGLPVIATVSSIDVPGLEVWTEDLLANHDWPDFGNLVQLGKSLA